MKTKSSLLGFGIFALILVICGVVALQYLGVNSEQNKIDKRVLFQSAIDKMNADYERKYGVIRNPYDPRFDPGKFDFEYYGVNVCSMREILAKLFQPGTSQEFVDYVLVKTGGAEKKKSPSHLGNNRYSYHYNLKTGVLAAVQKKWIVAVQYDDQDKVSTVSIGSRSVYDYAQSCNSKIHIEVGSGLIN